MRKVLIWYSVDHWWANKIGDAFQICKFFQRWGSNCLWILLTIRQMQNYGTLRLKLTKYVMILIRYNLLDFHPLQKIGKYQVISKGKCRVCVLNTENDHVRTAAPPRWNLQSCDSHWYHQRRNLTLPQRRRTRPMVYPKLLPVCRYTSWLLTCSTCQFTDVQLGQTTIHHE